METLMVAEQLLEVAPDLAVWQVSIGGLLMGPGTPYLWRSRDGFESMPPVRTQDEPRPWAHGDWTAPDWAASRPFVLTYKVRAASPEAYDAALDAAERVLVVGAVLTMWVRLPRKGIVRWTVKPRRHEIPTDAAYDARLLTDAALQLYAADPVGYGPGESATTGFRQALGGLAFPLFSDGGTLVPGANFVPDPRLKFATMTTGGATVVDTRSTTLGPNGHGYFRRHMTTANTSSPVQMNLAGTGLAGIPVTDTEPWTGSWYARKFGTGGPTTRIDLTWYDAAGAILGGTVLGQASSAGTSWLRYQQTFTPPAGAAYAFPRLIWTGIANIDQDLDFADAQWEAGSVATPYGDGDTPGWSWSGTPDASASAGNTVVGAVDIGHLDFGEQGDAGELTLTNPGTAETWAVHTIAGPTPPEGFDILDVPSGRRLRYVQEVLAGSEVVIDTATATVTLDGVADRSRYLTVREWTPIAAGGQTTIAFLPLGAWTTGQLTAAWAPAWW